MSNESSSESRQGVSPASASSSAAARSVGLLAKAQAAARARAQGQSDAARQPPAADTSGRGLGGAEGRQVDAGRAVGTSPDGADRAGAFARCSVESTGGAGGAAAAPNAARRVTPVDGARAMPRPERAAAGAFGRFGPPYSPGAASGRRAAAAAPGEDWPDDETPPGSCYSHDEWLAARREGEVANGGRPVILIEVRNGGQSAFLTLPAAPLPQRGRVRGAGGQLQEELVPPSPEELAGCFDPTLGDMMDGCLLLAPSAQTSHPQAACSTMLFETEFFGAWTYRLARPRAHMETHRCVYATMKMLTPYPLLPRPATDADDVADEDRRTELRERG